MFHITVMLLVMEMNGFVVISIALGMGAGHYYTLTQNKHDCCH